MTAATLCWLNPGDPPDAFPDIRNALEEPNGLLAAGGDLSPERLLVAYRRGIFPWYDEGQPILWWSPDPRCVLRPERFHTSRSLRKAMRRSTYSLRSNAAFADVIAACAEPRPGQAGTWIIAEMIDAYTRLHDMGWAHSLEAWDGDRLVGGIYGLAIGKAFFGESMFSRETNASKFAMAGLCRLLAGNGFEVLDCQVPSLHLGSLGANLIPRERFASILERACTPATAFENWPDAPISVSELGV
ncbi:MAG: leucyl/phenylalanyl-tRNA--protein transferase [Woeseiaceae bacterium]|nr:leucyl/phenylalanyl-tRNA--protein transferase [Woeseiaceae bacterium]